MGAALLQTPNKVKAILTALVEGVDIPITCKIRILPKVGVLIKSYRMPELSKLWATAPIVVT